MRRAIFTHLDLGLGGAENLVVSAALALQNRGYAVEIYTTRHEPSRAFKATIDGTLTVRVVGAFLPMTLFGRCTMLCSAIRMLYLALYLLVTRAPADVIINDQVALINPLLRLVSPRVIFYCHYPDLLLCVDRSSWWKRAYRKVFDSLEERTTGSASVTLVNSHFTAGVFREAFPSLAGVRPAVVHPPVAAPAKVKPLTAKWLREYHLRHALVARPETAALLDELRGVGDAAVPRFFVSVNRYERKKAVGRAIEALAGLLAAPQFTNAEEDPPKPFLVVAGGYDAQVAENVEHHEELYQLARQRGVAGRVLFWCSIPELVRNGLLRTAVAVIYTPPNEHFGIVPVEAMSLGTPVICDRSGGPLETVGNALFPGEPGVLTDGVEDMATAMAALWAEQGAAQERRRAACLARAREFSLDRMGENLEAAMKRA